MEIGGIIASGDFSWDAVLRTLSLLAGFNTTTVILGTTLLGLAAGVIGVFALLRKRSLMTDGLSHATLPGIVIAFLLASALGAEGRSMPVLLAGAAATGVLGVLCIQGILRHTRLHEDAAIGVVLSVFFGVGIVGLSYVQANAAAGAAGLNTFIYGQTAAMSPADAGLMGGIALLAILSALLLRKEFSLVCFNDEFARAGGWPVSIIDLLMMALVVLVTVAGLQAVGLILVVAMLIIPPVAARFWTDRQGRLLLLSGVIGALSGYLGSVISALFPRKPAGAVIVLTAGAIFALSMMVAPKRGVVAALARQFSVRLRIAGDHVLEAAYERAQQGARDRASPAARAWPLWFRWIVSASLRWRGLMSAEAQPTAAGLARGDRVSRNHRLWTQYLISHADIAPSHVDWSVDQVEHVLSEELIRELETALAVREASSSPARAGAAA